jgi:hypothetical protein
MKGRKSESTVTVPYRDKARSEILQNNRPESRYRTESMHVRVSLSLERALSNVNYP